MLEKSGMVRDKIPVRKGFLPSAAKHGNFPLSLEEKVNILTNSTPARILLRFHVVRIRFSNPNKYPLFSLILTLGRYKFF